MAVRSRRVAVDGGAGASPGHASFTTSSGSAPAALVAGSSTREQRNLSSGTQPRRRNMPKSGFAEEQITGPCATPLDPDQRPFSADAISSRTHAPSSPSSLPPQRPPRRLRAYAPSAYAACPRTSGFSSSSTRRATARPAPRAPGTPPPPRAWRRGSRADLLGDGSTFPFLNPALDKAPYRASEAERVSPTRPRASLVTLRSRALWRLVV